ncbi:MAG: hypothetical protein JW795_02750 [Chitinivibrionales bacterium]|nr:hypothetical protein [Chitinivibrionales bacterium]
MRYCGIIIVFLITYAWGDVQWQGYVPGILASRSFSISDSSRYNSYCFAHNPLGLLRQVSTLVEMNVGYTQSSLSSAAPHDSTFSNSGLTIPRITISTPQKMYLSLAYGRTSLAVKSSTETITTPPSFVSILMAGQTSDARLKAGLAADLFWGEEKGSSNSRSRAILGFRNGGIGIGSAVHETVDLELFAHTAATVDTLYTGQTHWPQDRNAELLLPQIDITAHFGTENIPFRSILCYTYARKHFVYTQKADPLDMVTFYAIAGFNGVDHPWDADALVSDSIHFRLNTIATILLPDNLSTLQPAAAVGYMTTNGKRMKPGLSNKPLKYNGVKDGYEWNTSSFELALATALAFKNYGKLWGEFDYDNLKINLTGDQYPDSITSQPMKNYQRLEFGLRCNLDAFTPFQNPNLSTLNFSCIYQMLQRGWGRGGFFSGPLTSSTPIAANSALMRYQIWQQVKTDIKTAGLTIAIQAGIRQNILLADLYWTLLNQTSRGKTLISRSGHELGIGITYNRVKQQLHSAR